MDNENKDFELESQEMEPGTEAVVEAEQPEMEPDAEAVDIEPQEEFDPTESDEFYNNLETAIDGVEEPEEELPELVLEDALFATEGEEEPVQDKDVATVEEEMFAGVDAALSERIENEFGKEIEPDSEGEKKPGKFLAVWKAIPTWTKVLVTVILTLLLTVGLLFGTSGGRKLFYRVVIEIMFAVVPKDPDDSNLISTTPGLNAEGTPGPTANPDDPFGTPGPTGGPDVNPSGMPDATPVPSQAPEVTQVPLMDDDDIINILLLGEENMWGDVNGGRTDAIILVSINRNGGPLKVVSFLRDMFVEIPGYKPAKLNEVYSLRGSGTTTGARKVMETLEYNFGVDIDSYVKVGFDGFENIIDQLGGIEITLTAKESEYLNTTKYISKPEERNTVAGTQIMTGSQALGYCRVRLVPAKTTDGKTLYQDWGRNYRQRTVISAVVNKFKSEDFGTIVSLGNQCLKYVAVPSDLKEVALDCLTAVLEKKMFTIETLQMPQSGKCHTQKLENRQDEVVIYDISNVDDLQAFLYGDQ